MLVDPWRLCFIRAKLAVFSLVCSWVYAVGCAVVAEGGGDGWRVEGERAGARLFALGVEWMAAAFLLFCSVSLVILLFHDTTRRPVSTARGTASTSTPSAARCGALRPSFGRVARKAAGLF